MEETAFARCAAPFYYEGPVRQAILNFKFRGKVGALECFGSLMAQCAAEHFSGEFDAITWVPVSKKRLKKEGLRSGQVSDGVYVCGLAYGASGDSA